VHVQICSNSRSKPQQWLGLPNLSPYSKSKPHL
jgi:hypothetical protein